MGQKGGKKTKKKTQNKTSETYFFMSLKNRECFNLYTVVFEFLLHLKNSYFILITIRF